MFDFWSHSPDPNDDLLLLAESVTTAAFWTPEKQQYVLLERWLVHRPCMLGFVSPSNGLLGLQVESSPVDNFMVPKEKYTAVVSRNGSKLTCSWAKMSQQIMPQWMVSLPGHREAAEINCSPSKCFLRSGTWSQLVSSSSLWFLAQHSRACSEIPPGRDRALYKQEKWSWDPQKLKFAGNVSIGRSAQHQRVMEWEEEGMTKINEKRSKFSRRPVVYGRQNAAEEEAVKEGVRWKLTKEQRKIHIPVAGGPGWLRRRINSCAFIAVTGGCGCPHASPGGTDPEYVLWDTTVLKRH